MAKVDNIGVKWKLNDKHTLTFGSGLHSKPEPVSIYLAEKELSDRTVTFPNKNLKITKAVHAVFGYNWNFVENFMLKTELYYQYLFDVPVDPTDTTNTMSTLNFGSGFTNDNFVNQGTGRNYGVELTLQKFFSNNWYLLATASLFESKFTMPGDVERNTLYNSKYIYNFVAGKDLK